MNLRVYCLFVSTSIKDNKLVSGLAGEYFGMAISQSILGWGNLQENFFGHELGHCVGLEHYEGDAYLILLNPSVDKRI